MSKLINLLENDLNVINEEVLQERFIGRAFNKGRLGRMENREKKNQDRFTKGVEDYTARAELTRELHKNTLASTGAEPTSQQIERDKKDEERIKNKALKANDKADSLRKKIEALRNKESRKEVKHFDKMLDPTKRGKYLTKVENDGYLADLHSRGNRLKAEDAQAKAEAEELQRIEDEKKKAAEAANQTPEPAVDKKDKKKKKEEPIDRESAFKKAMDRAKELGWK